MLRKVDSSSTFCNRLSILLLASQLATHHSASDWPIFPALKAQKRGKDGEHARLTSGSFWAGSKTADEDNEPVEYRDTQEPEINKLSEAQKFNLCKLL